MLVFVSSFPMTLASFLLLLSLPSPTLFAVSFLGVAFPSSLLLLLLFFLWLSPSLLSFLPSSFLSLLLILSFAFTIACLFMSLSLACSFPFATGLLLCLLLGLCFYFYHSLFLDDSLLAMLA